MNFPQQIIDQDPEWPEWCRRHDILRNDSGLRKLRTLKIRSQIHDAVKANRPDKLTGISGQLTDANHFEMLKELIEVEEAYRSISLRKYDMSGKRLRPIRNRNGRIKSAMLKVDGLSHGKPDLNGCYEVVLGWRGYRKKFSIADIQDDDVVLTSPRRSDIRRFLWKRLDIAFISKGIDYHYLEKACELASGSDFIKSVIFEGNNDSSSDSKLSPVSERLDTLDEEQHRAVDGILKAKCRPYPYFLFCPPGSGKTRTVKEAMVQIYALDRGAKILFCAYYKASVHNMEKKLKEVEIIQSSDILHLSRGDKADGSKLCRIVLTTIGKSGSFMENIEYEFDYVFIDEADQAHEPQTLLPIISLKSDGCLVLIGDPRRLGRPVKWGCEGHGLNRSMFERIFEFKVYQKDRRTNEYDARYITKLLNCYGYDPKVLAISNKIFYDDELTVLPSNTEAAKPILERMNPERPVQFQDVRGEEFYHANSRSWSNDPEADSCVELVLSLYEENIEPDQIGVMSPFRAQANLIGKKLTERLKAEHQGLADWQTCEIDTIDGFKRTTHEIIILSMVRSPSSPMDFINPLSRRFNVAMTRATRLLFVIGHRGILERGGFWFDVSEFFPPC